jgi:chromosome segregation ATPase
MLILLIIIIIILIILLYLLSNNKLTENFEDCICNCKDLNKNIEKMCANEKKNINDCNLELQSSKEKCKREILKQQTESDTNNLQLDNDTNQLKLMIASDNSYIERCNKNMDIIKNENEILEKRNLDLRSKLSELTFQFQELNSNNTSCLTASQDMTKMNTDLNTKFLDMTNNYDYVYKSIPQIIENKKAINTSLHLCNYDPPPPPPPKISIKGVQYQI